MEGISDDGGVHEKNDRGDGESSARKWGLKRKEHWVTRGRGAKLNEHAQSWSVCGANASEEERRQMHHELQGLMDKYEDMVKRMRGSSLVDQLLTSTDLPYSMEVMAALLPLKFKVSQMEMYDGSKDPLER